MQFIPGENTFFEIGFFKMLNTVIFCVTLIISVTAFEYFKNGNYLLFSIMLLVIIVLLILYILFPTFFRRGLSKVSFLLLVPLTMFILLIGPIIGMIPAMILTIIFFSSVIAIDNILNERKNKKIREKLDLSNPLVIVKKYEHDNKWYHYFRNKKKK